MKWKDIKRFKALRCAVMRVTRSGESIVEEEWKILQRTTMGWRRRGYFAKSNVSIVCCRMRSECGPCGNPSRKELVVHFERRQSVNDHHGAECDIAVSESEEVCQSLTVGSRPSRHRV